MKKYLARRISSFLIIDKADLDGPTENGQGASATGYYRRQHGDLDLSD